MFPQLHQYMKDKRILFYIISVKFASKNAIIETSQSKSK